MSEIPGDLKYSKSHEWVRVEEGGEVTLGITDHAQEQLGDLVFVELPEEGGEVESGGECAVIESVKAASDVYSPVSGEITAINAALADTPEIINQDAFGEGWICRIRLANAAELDGLLDANAYAAVVEAEEH